MLQKCSFRSTLIISVFLLMFSGFGCQPKEDLTGFQTQISTLIAEYNGKVTGLSGTLDSLIKRAKTLPTDSAGGASLLKNLMTKKASLAAIGSSLKDVPSKLATAIQAGNKADVLALVTSLQSGPGAQLQKLQSQLGAFGPRLTVLEAAEEKKAAGDTVTLSWSKALPGGYQLKGADNGIERSLVTFIEDNNLQVDKNTWFNFDRLTFATGSASLDMAKSKDQLTNIAEILKAYPKVSAKLGGYTDNTGNAAANKKLSMTRATNVVKALVAMGVDTKRLAAEGYGQEFPVCPANDTKECRAQNRRIAARITAK